MSQDHEPVVTKVPNLDDWTINSLRVGKIDKEKTLKGIEKPRTNLGGTAPPGRAD